MIEPKTLAKIYEHFPRLRNVSKLKAVASTVLNGKHDFLSEKEVEDLNQLAHRPPGRPRDPDKKEKVGVWLNPSEREFVFAAGGGSWLARVIRREMGEQEGEQEIPVPASELGWMAGCTLTMVRAGMAATPEGFEEGRLEKLQQLALVPDDEE